MISRWTQHLKDQEDIERFKNSLLGQKWLLNRLSEILEEEEQSLDRSETTNKVYENSNWAYLQAHKNGYRQALSVLKKLVNLDPKEIK